MIFPHIEGSPAACVNLDDEAKRWRVSHPDILASHAKNPLLVPEMCQRMIDEMHARFAVSWSYGGWMENRSVFLQGSYLEADKRFVHLGIDLNVPPDTAVAATRKAEVIRIDDDRDEDIGWGPRVIAKMADGEEQLLLIYGHLSRDIRCSVGDILAPGRVFAAVGSPPTNGNVFPHLHLQAVTAEHFRKLLGNNLVDLDGYCSENYRKEAQIHFPNPLPYIYEKE